MEPSYSVWADWLSKFQTSSEGVQALWILCLTVTALGLIAGTTRVLVAFAGIFSGGREWARRVGVPLRGESSRCCPSASRLRPRWIMRREKDVGGRIKSGHDGGGW